MGSDKSTTTIDQTSTPQLTEAEKQSQQLGLEREQAVQPGLIQAQQGGLSLINQLMAGSTDLPGFFGELGQGISPDVTQGIVNQTLEDIRPGLQMSGIFDSGTRGAIEARTSADIRRATAEFNLGNKFNLLNLAFGGQAQVQQPLMQQQALLNQQLAGLRPVQTQGRQTETSMNPFLRSFQTGFGTSLGGGNFGAWQFGG